MDPQVSVNFCCQRCEQPVHLDQGFAHMSELTIAELSLPIHQGAEVNFEGQQLDKVVHALKLNESNGQHGFTILEDPAENQKLSPLKIATNLFDLLSSTSDVDHPLCEECTDFLLSALDESLARTERQTAVYEPLFGQESDSGREVCQGLESELEGLRAEEARLVRQLAQLEEEQASAQLVLNRCKEERRQLEEESTSYWREFCRYRCRVTGLEDENRSVKSRTNHLQHQLDSLRKTNVFNATFSIWFSGHFATINNLRLGRLPTAPVGWPEINAAWGQTALLLASLARKVNLSFSRYRIVPHGSSSYIEVIGENKEIPLYGSAGLRFLRDNKFDAGMAAFVECVGELQAFMKASGADWGVGGRWGADGFKLPYSVNGHCMEDTSGQLYSVKLQFNSEEQWTKALKFLLTNLKWGLTWVSSTKFPPTPERG